VAQFNLGAWALDQELKLGGARAAGLVSLGVVIHRPQDDAIRTLAREYRCHPEALRVNDAALSWTLRAGIEYIKSRGSTDPQQAILVCLGDQPLLRLDVIRALVEMWHRAGRSPPARIVTHPASRHRPGGPQPWHSP
jgi:CTP:molybdopterin cytidylyltransferase MocA